MKKLFKLITAIITYLMITISSYAENDFYNQAINKFNKKDYDEAKFLFERNIVFNPKDANSYLYLAKIKMQIHIFI